MPLSLHSGAQPAERLRLPRQHLQISSSLQFEQQANRFQRVTGIVRFLSGSRPRAIGNADAQVQDPHRQGADRPWHQGLQRATRHDRPRKAAVTVARRACARMVTCHVRFWHEGHARTIAAAFGSYGCNAPAKRSRKAPNDG